jgi:hypothetical protein
VHAIMHRREPDPWNSKYWWRRVGAHPCFPELARRAGAFLPTALGTRWPLWMRALRRRRARRRTRR